MRRTVMCIEIGSDSVYVQDPAHIPHLQSDVRISAGRRIMSGVVVEVSYDFTQEGSDDGELFISVKAR